MSLPVVDVSDNVPYEDPLDLMDEIDALKQEKNAKILAHYYIDSEIQDIADYTGDSLKLARDAASITDPVIVFCGVHFMGESAKILAPDKTVLMPDLKAGCSLAESCTYPDLKAFQDQLRDEGEISRLSRISIQLLPLKVYATGL